MQGTTPHSSMLEPVRENTTIWVPTRFDTNQSVQSQKMVEELYCRRLPSAPIFPIFSGIPIFSYILIPNPIFFHQTPIFFKMLQIIMKYQGKIMEF